MLVDSVGLWVLYWHQFFYWVCIATLAAQLIASPNAKIMCARTIRSYICQICQALVNKILFRSGISAWKGSVKAAQTEQGEGLT